MKNATKLLLLLGLMAFHDAIGQTGEDFFRIYPRNDKSMMPSCVVETSDSCYIVAVNAVSNHLDTIPRCGELFKISADGELLKTAAINEEEALYSINNIFPDPQRQGLFIGIGLHHGQPYLIHFDEELNIVLQRLVEIPDENKHFSTIKSVMDADNNIVSILLYDYQNPYYGHRFYAKMTTEGELLRLVEDVAEQPAVIGANAVFLFPDNGQVGIFRNTTMHPAIHQMLCKLNDELEADSIHGYGSFGHDTINLYQVKMLSMTEPALGTVLPMNDTTLLFSYTADQWWTNTNFHDISSVLFKTDLQGNMRQHFVIGNWNDTLETTAAVLQCADFARYNSFEKRFLYQTCLSRSPDDQQPYLQRPNTFFVTKLALTDDFEILWRKSYALDNMYYGPRYLLGTADGGCLVVGYARRGETYYDDPHYDLFALKLNALGTVCTDEITVKDEMFFYPNPVRDMLHLHFPIEAKPTKIELFDLQGRLVKTQRTGLEQLDVSDLPAGTYTIRATINEGKVLMDKVVKE